MGGGLYRTARAAAKKLAWSWILVKYCNYGDLMNVKTLRGMKCECCDARSLEYGNRTDEICELHNRKWGYFARLHKKAMSAILKSWESVQ